MDIRASITALTQKPVSGTQKPGSRAPRLRPTLQDFARFGWVPNPKAYARWKAKLDKEVIPLARKLPTLGRLPTKDETLLIHPVQKFKDLIETQPEVYTDIKRMFEAKNRSIPMILYPKTIDEWMILLNHIVGNAPPFGDLGPPMYMIMARLMNTQGGFSAYTKSILNDQFKQMAQYWQTYLMTSASRSVLDPNGGDNSWLSANAVSALLKDFEGAQTLDQVFLCDTSLPYYGFASFEDFFNRKFNPETVGTYRPLAPPGGFEPGQEEKVISAPCESGMYALQYGVKIDDELFIKDEAYSLIHLLANDELAPQFGGGTVFQSFLQTTGYHRWHAPVNGRVVKIVDVPGTYFAQSPEFIGDELIMPPDGQDLPPDAPTHPYLKSLGFFAHTAARQLIFIEADNQDIGLLCFIAIGMTEISTCEATVSRGEYITRGQEIGMFHFGGSSSALVFRPSSGVRFDSKYETPGVQVKINEPAAYAGQQVIIPT